MDMSIGRKRPISQLGTFEKPRILVMQNNYILKNGKHEQVIMYANKGFTPI